MYSLHTVVGLIAVDPCSIACYRPFVQPIQGAHVLPSSIKQERKSPWLQRASGRLLGSQVLADALHRDRNCYEILDLLRLFVSPSTPPSKGGIFHPTIWSAAKFRETKNVITDKDLVSETTMARVRKRNQACSGHGLPSLGVSFEHCTTWI